MENFFNSFTWKVLLFIMKVIAVFISIDFAFFMMNRDNTISFVAGILLAIATIGVFIEHIKNNYFKNK